MQHLKAPLKSYALASSSAFIFGHGAYMADFWSSSLTSSSDSSCGVYSLFVWMNVISLRKRVWQELDDILSFLV